MLYLNNFLFYNRKSYSGFKIKIISYILMELFHNSIKQYKVILNFINKFIETVKDSIIANDPKKYEEVNLELKTALLNINAIKIDDTLEAVNNCYMLFAQLNSTIIYLFKLFNVKEYLKYRNATQSFNTVILEKKERDNMIDIFATLVNANINNDKQIFAMFEKTDIAKIFAFVSNKVNLNRFTIFLMSRIINEGTKVNTNLVRNMIESHKDNVLDSKRVMSDDGRIYMTKYGLNAGEFRDVMPKIKGNIVKITRNTNHPIEYDLRGIIDVKYIDKNHLTINAMSGLNERYMLKTNTIREGKPAKNANNIEIVKGATDNWTLLEIMNGKYRAIECSSVVAKGLSERPAKYAIASYVDVIDKSAFIILDKYKNIEQHIESTEPVRAKIVDNIMIILSAQPIAELRDFRNIDITELQVQHIIDNAQPLKRRNVAIQKEVFFTYYSRLYYISFEFTKRLRKEFHITKMDNTIFKDYNQVDINKYFNSARIRVINKVLDDMDILKMFAHFSVSLKETVMREKYEETRELF
jgi:hypothetical protein